MEFKLVQILCVLQSFCCLCLYPWFLLVGRPANQKDINLLPRFVQIISFLCRKVGLLTAVLGILVGRRSLLLGQRVPAFARQAWDRCVQEVGLLLTACVAAPQAMTVHVLYPWIYLV